MIEQALYEHLKIQDVLGPYLARYNSEYAIFNQEAPDDRDELWDDGPQYGRIVFSVDLSGDPERTMGGILAVDILCKEDEQYPEEIEPIIRSLIHGYFFSNGTFTVAAQWKNSSYFTEPPQKVTGCTITFDLLGFPVLTTYNPDVIERVNEWCASLPGNIHVINYIPLPESAWKPSEDESAVYWRLVTDKPASWIRDSYQTIWRTATIKCHIFSRDNAMAAFVARMIATSLQAEKRLVRDRETQIMVDRLPTVDFGADPLRTGQVTVEATYGIIVHIADDPPPVYLPPAPPVDPPPPVYRPPEEQKQMFNNIDYV